MAEIRRGFYRHWKGGIYFVSGLAISADDPGIDGPPTLVVYESIEGCNGNEPVKRVHKIKDFTAIVQDRDGHPVPRFARVESWL